MPDWYATADAKMRMLLPEQYWCVRDDDGVQYFWNKQTVSREEYLAHSGKDDCAAA